MAINRRQSLAFMLGNERAGAGHLSAGLKQERGGWLCDEVGMGKTVVCIALILANQTTRSVPLPSNTHD